MTEETDEAEFDPVADLHERQRQIRQEMGGADRVAKMQEEGTPPELEDIIKLMDGVDMMDAIDIGPKLLNCYDKCQPHSQQIHH